MAHLITKQGLEDLQAEYKKIIEIDLPSILDSLEKAKAEGDLSENAALDASKIDLDRVNTRKNELEEVLADFEIIDESIIDKNKVQIGNSVEIRYLEDNEVLTVKIVGSSESNILDFKISNESPLAKAILGKKKGSKSKFKHRNQEIEVEILNII